MNASVIDKVEGLGDVPVIVLVSALDEAARDAYLTDVATRAAREAEADAAEKAEADAKAEAEAAQAPPDGAGFLGKLFGGSEDAAEDPASNAAPVGDAPKIGCATGKDGVKRCSVETTAPTD
jgi:hypothetical protein